MNPIVSRFAADADRLIGDRSVTGRRFCTAYTELVDAWLVELFESGLGQPAGVALVALGGHGRSELTPGGDIDLMILHPGDLDADRLASLWYPIWDAGLKLGHSSRTPKEAMTLAKDDLPSATALLTARTLVGDAVVTDALSDEVARLWRRRSGRLLGELGQRIDDRHARNPEVAFALEPDLKEGHGGAA